MMMISKSLTWRKMPLLLAKNAPLLLTKYLPGAHFLADQLPISAISSAEMYIPVPWSDLQAPLKYRVFYRRAKPISSLSTTSRESRPAS
jgi:hypothetical protein